MISVLNAENAPPTKPHRFPSLLDRSLGNRAIQLVLRQRLERHCFDQHLYEMISMCLAYGIEEVLLFPHGVSIFDSRSGFWDDEELDIDIRFLEAARRELHANGIRMGINIWQTIGHADRGRKMGGKFQFHPLVSEHGYAAASMACPLCPEWRKYYFRCLEKYAQVRPDRFYFDDDLRYQNHGISDGPPSFSFCYCDLHIRAFNERHGTSYDREGLIRDIARPGKPHLTRRLWLHDLNEQLVEFTRICEQRFHALSPDTDIGLMSSNSDQMCGEGRNWNQLLRSIAGPNRPLFYRPNYPDYLEVEPRDLAHSLASYRQIFADLPKDCVSFAEIDNCMPTEFNQSPAHLCLRMLLAFLCGTRGFHLSLFEWNGNQDVFSGNEEYGAMVHAFRESVDPLLSLLTGPAASRGIYLIQNPNRVLEKETVAGNSPAELRTNTLVLSRPLQLAGFPITFDRSDTVALTEDALWGLSRQEVTSILSGLAILDHTAIRWMVRHGHGDLIGVKSMTEVPVGTFAVTVEEVIDPEDPFFGARFDHKPLIQTSPEVRYELHADAVPVTRLMGRQGDEFGPGGFRFLNSLGGTILGVPLFPESMNANPFQTRYRLSGIRKQLSLYAQRKGTPWFHIEGQPNVLPLHLSYGSKTVLACVNLRSQSAADLRFCCNALPEEYIAYLWHENVLSSLDLEVGVRNAPEAHVIRVTTPVPFLGVCILISDSLR